MFSRVLIAARGEIALRILRACKELGIETVVVYSKADANAIYLRFADRAIKIGPAESSESYLNEARIIAAAEVADVDAIHPGYGFLSEAPTFAEVCRDCRIEFIGPSPEVMKIFGDKSKAREVARSLGIPVVPGSDGPITDDQAAREIASKIGYPVIIKAAAGGGGRGMRIARNEISLASNLMVASGEAEKSFSDSRVYIEKYISGCRHVEVQILADRHGNVVHLGERDCSLQRRHQKLVEETPCPVLTEKTRTELCRAAVKLMKGTGYRGAGTVEFLVDPNGKFYFIEVNCRIQVEHPVTEMVTGVDIVKEQLRIAAGEPLSINQNAVKTQGTAIECRINAEDPANGYRPCPGKITQFYPPGGGGIRVDTHVYAGYEVPPFYDSLLAKLIVHGRTRREAISIMIRALDEFVIEGVKTTIPLYKEIFLSRAYLQGAVDTSFIEKEFFHGST